MPPFDHPALVLAFFQRPNSTTVGDLILTVATMSSFNNMQLDEWEGLPIVGDYRRATDPVKTGLSQLDIYERLKAAGQKFLYLDCGFLEKQNYVGLW